MSVPDADSPFTRFVVAPTLKRLEVKALEPGVCCGASVLRELSGDWPQIGAPLSNLRNAFGVVDSVRWSESQDPPMHLRSDTMARSDFGSMTYVRLRCPALRRSPTRLHRYCQGGASLECAVCDSWDSRTEPRQKAPKALVGSPVLRIRGPRPSFAQSAECREYAARLPGAGGR